MASHNMKEPYQKPQVGTLKLSPDEVMAKGCKTQRAGPGKKQPGPCVSLSSCVGNGS